MYIRLARVVVFMSMGCRVVLPIRSVRLPYRPSMKNSEVPESKAGSQLPTMHQNP